MMNDPDNRKDAQEKPSNKDKEGGSFFFGGSFSNEIGLVLLAGFAYGAFQWGGDALDRLANWIDGEQGTPAVAMTLEFPDQEQGHAKVSQHAQPVVEITTEVGAEEAPAMPGVDIVDGDMITLDSFRLLRRNSWLVEPNIVPFEPHPYFGRLLDAHLVQGRNDPALLLTHPESYVIQMPDDVGQIFLLTKRVFINRQMNAEEVQAAVEAAGQDSVHFINPLEGVTSRPSVTAPDTEDGKQLVLLGSVPSATISENDLFDQYFLEHLHTILSLRNTHGSIDLRHIRRSVIDGYEIGEVDYIIGPGTLRMTSVFYWHYEAGAPWGDFGLFLSLRREPVSNAHQQEFEMMSSLTIMNGEQEIWRGLNYDADPDAEIGPFVHVALEATRLLSFGLDVEQVEHKLHGQLPANIDEIENIVIKTDGDSSIFLRDIALVDTYPLGEEITLRAPDSLVLTVTQ